MLFHVVLAVSVSFASAAPATGSCLCVTASAVNVRDAAGIHSHVITSMNRGECYIFNGGVLTKDGHTWYELQDVHSHHRAWAASEYLQVSAHSSCGGGSSSGAGTFTSGWLGDAKVSCIFRHRGIQLILAYSWARPASLAAGLVSQQCLQCICMQESGCRPIGCHWDVNSNSCGYFQIKQGYWTDCKSPGSSWQSCADDKQCASKCVQKYMERYAALYNCPMTCEGFAREHNGGPRGCHHTSTLSYWHHVKSHTGCHNLV